MMTRAQLRWFAGAAGTVLGLLAVCAGSEGVVRWWYCGPALAAALLLVVVSTERRLTRRRERGWWIGEE